MNTNKVIAAIVISSFVIGGGLIAAANILNKESITRNASSSSSEYTEKDMTIGSNINSTSESKNETDKEKPSDIQVMPRDENGVELIYDVTPITNAYLLGDSSSLSEKECEILDTAEIIISSIITDKMTDYEKELAFHDYIILNNEYNDNILNVFGESNFDDSSPYGVLIEHKSICKGYATTFKLLCNMCGIENEILTEYEDNDISHAYNRVKLNDCWYYVDVTWDDNEESIDQSTIDHHYFNCTKQQFMYDHNVDKSAPETTADKYLYARLNYQSINSVNDFKNAVIDQINEAPCCRSYFKLDKSLNVDLKCDSNSIGYDTSFDFDENVDILLKSIYPYTGDYQIFLSKTIINNEIILCVDIL